MLKFLHIENIAVIERSDIEFSAGFNVLTGETGAGKSIVIDAINAVLGERTSKELIRAGCDTAEVSAVFGELDNATAAALSDAGVTPDDDGNIVIRRRLSAAGKGLIKLNDRPVTATELKEIGKHLVNIHGQHDNQALLDPERHLDYIDAVADDDPIKGKYYAEFRELNRIRKELAATETDEDEKRRRVGLLKYQINELESAGIKPGEYEKLQKKLAIARNYQKTAEALSRAYSALKGDDEFDGAVSLLTDAEKSLSSLRNDEWDKKSSALADAAAAAEDVSAALYDFLENAELADIDPDEINSRLETLDKLMAKYGNSEEAVLKSLEEKKKRLEELENYEELAFAAKAEFEEQKRVLGLLCGRLSKEREKAAKILENRITEELEDLNFLHVEFRVDVHRTDHFTAAGSDEVEFLISTNPGSIPPRPLGEVASGGELSRIMLAIKTVLADTDDIPTLIFDEIDTGISGRTAQKVSERLSYIGKKHQVLCITHLPQIAAMADTHFEIKKSVENGVTATKIRKLTEKDEVDELARLLGGAEITENVRENAEEMKRLAEETKNHRAVLQTAG